MGGGWIALDRRLAMNATTPNTQTHELTDAELNAVTGGFGGNLADAVVKGVNAARDEYYLSRQH